MKKSGFLSILLPCVGLSFVSISNFVLAAPAQDGEAHCEQIYNGWRYRCSKSGSGANEIRIYNKSSERVLFDIDKWVKPSCNSGGGSFVNKTPFNINTGELAHYSFEEAAKGTCIELTIMDCRTASKPKEELACPKFLEVTPKR
jgi:hypothetical protein